MATVMVPALKALTYQGRSYVRGELVSLPAVEAAARARRGEVTLTVGAKVPVAEAVAEAGVEVPQRPRRRYRRRDMTAEGAE